MQNDLQTSKDFINGAYPVLGKIALKYQTISQEQLDKATAVFNKKLKADSNYSFKRVLIEEKMASIDQIDLLLIIQEYWDTRFAGEKFGTVAIRKGYLSQNDIDFAIKIQKHNFFSKKINQRIGDILIDKGILTKQQCDEIIAEQKKGCLPIKKNFALNDKTKNKDDETEILDLEKQFHKTVEQDKKFIEIAITKGFTSQLEIDRALLKQEMEYTIRKFLRTIHEILITDENISDDQAHQILEELKTKLIVNKDAISEHMKNAVKIIIQKDNFSAYLHIKKSIKNITVEFIENLINEKKIIIGVIKKDKIADFIKGGLSAPSKIKIAQGILPQTANSKTVKYLFEQNTDSNNILLEVEKDDTIALIEQKTQGKSGKDIFGNLCPPLSSIFDASLICGYGVRLADNEKSIIASIEGQPCKTIDGKFNVFSKTLIQGDADVKAGPIEGHTNISITGVLTGAFPVKGASLSAKEVKGANVNLTGDVIITTGIKDSHIITQGSVSAKYILNSKISAFCDIIVENEIINSTILTSGKCTVEKNKIIASNITAKGGIYSINIGSKDTDACNITVGTDDHIKSEINKIDIAISKLQNKLDEHENQKKRFELIRNDIQKQTKQMKAINSKVRKVLKSLQTQEQNKKTKSLIKEVSAKKDETLISIEKLAEKQKSIINNIINVKRTIKTIEPKIKPVIAKYHGKKNMFINWAKKKQSVSEIIVTGEVKAGTTFNSPNATTTFGQSYKNILSKEVNNQKEMVIINK